MSDLRCAAQLLEVGADPAGSAGSYDGWALAAWPLPWPPDLGEVAGLGSARAALAALPGIVRLQAVVPVAGAPAAVLHRRPEGPFAGYARSEGPSLEVAAGAAGSAGRDVLVCTHGRRDRCCGSFGTELWQDLQGWAGEGDRVWRTSHTGGHRFAPTMVVLPEGTVWGQLDAAAATQILDRRGPAADVARHYRGCTGLASPQLQALEREVLSEVGWDLLDQPREGFDLGGGRWALEATSGRWEATVTPGRSWPVPDCGEPMADARKSGTAWDVAVDERP